MKSSQGDVREIRKNVLAGIAVMNEDFERAKDLLASIVACGELMTCQGTRYSTFSAVDELSLDGLTDFQVFCESEKIRCFLALPVPVKDLEIKPIVDGNVVTRNFCSINGLPIRTDKEVAGIHYEYFFKRATFWLIKLVVDASGMTTTYYATLFGQFKTADGHLVYRPVTRKSFDTEAGIEIEKPITKKLKSEDEAVRHLGINRSLLCAMTKSCVNLAEIVRRRSSLRGSISRASMAPLVSAIGETFPGLEALKVKLLVEEEPVMAE